MAPREVTCRHCGTRQRGAPAVCSECGAFLRLSSSALGHGFGTPTGGGGRRTPPPAGERRQVSLQRRLLAGALVIVFAAAAAGFGAFLYRAFSDWSLATGSTTITTALTTTTAGTTSSTDAGAGTTTTTEAPSPGEQIFPSESKASSFLPPSGGIGYNPDNLTDGDLTTAWNEGAEGRGVGEWVQFYFSPTVKLERIEIANGYQKDDRRFSGNVRVRVLRVEYSNGESHLVELFDDQGFQSVEPMKKSFDWIRFTIVSVYPDASWDDAALSEVRFFGSRQ